MDVGHESRTEGLLRPFEGVRRGDVGSHDLFREENAVLPRTAHDAHDFVGDGGAVGPGTLAWDEDLAGGLLVLEEEQVIARPRSLDGLDDANEADLPGHPEGPADGHGAHHLSPPSDQPGEGSIAMVEVPGEVLHVPRAGGPTRDILQNDHLGFVVSPPDIAPASRGRDRGSGRGLGEPRFGGRWIEGLDFIQREHERPGVHGVQDSEKAVDWVLPLGEVIRQGRVQEDPRLHSE